MKKLIMLLSFLGFILMTFPVNSIAAEDTKNYSIEDLNNIEIVDKNYEFHIDKENLIIFPEKIVDKYTNDNGKVVTETDPVDNFKITDSGIEVDGNIIAKFPSSNNIGPRCIACGCTYTDINTVSRTTEEYNEFLTWHPDFDNYLEVSGYYFSNSSTSIGISIPGYYGVTFDVSYTPSGSGYYINTYDENTPSRPYIEGDIKKHYYQVVEKRCNGTTIDSYYNTTYYVDNEQIKIAFQ